MVKWMWYILIALICIVVILILCLIKVNRKNKNLRSNTKQILVEQNKYSQEVNKKITRLEYRVRQYEYFSKSLKIFNFEKAVNILENNRGELYIVMESYRRDSLNFYLSGYAHQGICNCPRLLSTIKDTYIWIDDIFAIDENCGNGTLLLSCLFNKAKELNISEIKGELSPVDVEKFDKLEHFYVKNEFEVCFNKERSRGLIQRKI